MKITKRQLRRIIREEKARLMKEVSPADMGMAAARMDDQRRDEINTNMQVPAELFNQILELIEDIANSGTPGGGYGKRAGNLLLKMERELGIL